MALDIPQQMIKAARLMNGRFCLNGRPLTMEEVFSPMGMLPGIARRADQLSSLCLGYGIGATFEEAEGTPLSIKVIFDDITLNVLGELMKGSAGDDMTSLDQLMYD